MSEKSAPFLTLCNVLQAIERGEGDGRDWHASKESLIQARADEKTIQELLGKIYAKQQVSNHSLHIADLALMADDLAYTNPALLHWCQQAASTAERDGDKEWGCVHGSSPIVASLLLLRVKASHMPDNQGAYRQGPQDMLLPINDRISSGELMCSGSTLSCTGCSRGQCRQGRAD